MQGILRHATNDAQACRTSSVLASSSGGWKARELHQGEARKSSGTSLSINEHGLQAAPHIAPHAHTATLGKLPSIQIPGCHSPAVPAHHAGLVAVLDCLLGHIPAGGNQTAQQHHVAGGLSTDSNCGCPAGAGRLRESRPLSQSPRPGQDDAGCRLCTHRSPRASSLPFSSVWKSISRSRSLASVKMLHRLMGGAAKAALQPRQQCKSCAVHATPPQAAAPGTLTQSRVSARANGVSVQCEAHSPLNCQACSPAPLVCQAPIHQHQTPVPRAPVQQHIPVSLAGRPIVLGIAALLSTAHGCTQDAACSSRGVQGSVSGVRKGYSTPCY